MPAVNTEPETLKLQQIDTGEQLELLHQAWMKLYRACPEATPFQSPSWLLPWWRHLGFGNLCCLSVWKGSALCGLLPCFIRDGNLLLLGTGLSDHLDALCHPSFTTGAAVAVCEHLAGLIRARKLKGDFQQLRPDSNLLSVRQVPGISARVEFQEFCPVLRLPEKVEELPGLIPEKWWGRLAYCRRRWIEFGNAQVETATLETFPEFLEAFFKLHRARWMARNQPGVLAEESVIAFHRESAWLLMREDSLRLFGLRISNRIEACMYALKGSTRLLFYLSGFNPEISRVSPGTLLIGYAIEQAVHEGLGEFSFLRGREPYKYKWGARDEPNYRVLFTTEPGDEI